MPKFSTNKKVAIVYDWADTAYGGAEKVLLTLKKIYPQAVLFVPLADRCQAKWLTEFSELRTGFLQSFPAWVKKNRFLCSLFLPLCVENFDLSGFDLVISVASFAAKGVLTKPEQNHVCYLLTPTRFLHSHRREYLPPLGRFLAAPLLAYLRRWDVVAAGRPDYIIPISHLVAARTQQYYQRETLPVIYPPLVLTADDHQKIAKSDFYLAVGRLVAYKKMDLAVRACVATGVKLKVVGTGPQLKKLRTIIRRARAGERIELLSRVSDEDLKKLYAQAKAVLMIGEEDFGLVALEANAAGTIVVGHQRSGALEILPSAAKLALTSDSLLDTIQAIKLLEKRTDWSASPAAGAYDQAHFAKNWIKQIEKLKSEL